MKHSGDCPCATCASLREQVQEARAQRDAALADLEKARALGREYYEDLQRYRRGYAATVRERHGAWVEGVVEKGGGD